MPEPDLTLKDWMDARGISADTVATSLKVGLQTVKNWRSIGVPDRRKAHVAYFMSTWKESATPAEEIRQNLVLRPTPEQFDHWNDAALAEGLRMSDWALRGLDQLAGEHDSGLTLHPGTARDREEHWQRANSSKVADKGK